MRFRNVFLACLLIGWAAPLPCSAIFVREPFPYARSSLRPGGGHHGHRTDMLDASARFLVARGSDADTLPCSLRRGIGPDAGAMTAAHVAATLSRLLHADERTLLVSLTHPSPCSAWEAARLPSPAPAVQPAAIPFAVRPDGVPLSSNMLWNRCIARPTDVPLPLVRGNPDRVAANARGTLTRPKTCGDYFLGDDRWRHPDFPGLEFVFSAKPQPMVWVPPPYVIVRR